MQFLFWFSILLILYTYVGYPLHIWVLARLFPRPVLKGDPSTVASQVSIVISARNEQTRIKQRIENLLTQDYPPELLEIIIVSDGSTDNTIVTVQQLIVEHADSKIELLILNENKGKPTALNAGIEIAKGEFIVFTDCRQTFKPDVIRQLIANFEDPDVGCVSGELNFWQDSDSQIEAEIGAYWKYEKFIRKNESASGSVVGATGAIYAIRKELYRLLPTAALIDDVLTPLNLAKQGKRIVFDGAAVAYDVVSDDATQEGQRKVRTLAGNWQLINLCDGLFNPIVNPLCWRFIGHKFLRLLVPFALLTLLLTSFTQNSWFAQLFGWCQIVGYFFVCVAHFSPSFRKFRLVNIAYFFTVLNLAAFFGFCRWISNTHEGTWQASPKKTLKSKGVPVLMYHALEDEVHPAGYTDPGDKVYVLQVDQFREQMTYLKENGFQTYLIDELLELDNFPEKAVVLTFDDGHESNATLALPILQECGFKAHFFITTGWIATQKFMSEEQIKELATAGMGIGSHGVTHRFLNNLAEAEVLNELVFSKETLESLISQKIQGISYPGGRVPQKERSCFHWGCTSSVDFFFKNTLLTALPRIAIKHSTSLNSFAKIVHCDRIYFQKSQFRDKILSSMKSVIGDELYARIHRIFAR